MKYRSAEALKKRSSHLLLKCVYLIDFLIDGFDPFHWIWCHLRAEELGLSLEERAL
jgi:hypothetical protein